MYVDKEKEYIVCQGHKQPGAYRKGKIYPSDIGYLLVCVSKMEGN